VLDHPALQRYARVTAEQAKLGLVTHSRHTWPMELAELWLVTRRYSVTPALQWSWAEILGRLRLS
jgi:hypothetical protein